MAAITPLLDVLMCCFAMGQVLVHCDAPCIPYAMHNTTDDVALVGSSMLVRCMVYLSVIPLYCIALHGINVVVCAINSCSVAAIVNNFTLFLQELLPGLLTLVGWSPSPDLQGELAILDGVKCLYQHPMINAILSVSGAGLLYHLNRFQHNQGERYNTFAFIRHNAVVLGT